MINFGQEELKFSGDDYDAAFDYTRLTGQIKRIFNLMRDGKWRSLDEIALATGDGAASVSAQLRNLRKPSFGEHTVERRSRGDRSLGLYEYRVVLK